uniref:T-cell surface glycoprotein CD1b isoform X3 n=1 Tax=Jaculus jaculus TaxID=51337 RepID=UPI001E1B1FA3|nr:T-cell surface glycoprotein CD1b isoform X3 [Jaculus jaculus]
MLHLPLALLAGLFPGGGNGDALQEPISFHVTQIASFANSTWAQNQGSGWVDDMQILGWDSETGTPIFLKPWSKGNLTDDEVTELMDIFRLYLFGFIKEVQKRAHDFQLEYPFNVQNIAGCELHSGGAIVSFLRSALGGVDFMSIQNGSCAPSPESGARGQKFCAFVIQYKGIRDIVGKLLLESCPKFLLGVLEAGKEDLQRQVKPEAWLSSSPGPGHGHVRLACHVSGFYPKPVWVTWAMGEQEQQGTQRGDTLPNADGTWYLRATLDVEAGKAAGLACRVKHSSLGGRDIVLYWGHPSYTGSIILAVLLSSLVFLLCLALWFFRHRRSYQDIL